MTNLLIGSEMFQTPADYYLLADFIGNNSNCRHENFSQEFSTYSLNNQKVVIRTCESCGHVRKFRQYSRVANKRRR